MIAIVWLDFMLVGELEKESAGLQTVWETIIIFKIVELLVNLSKKIRTEWKKIVYIFNIFIINLYYNLYKI